MPEFPETRKSLLVRMKSPGDDEAWTEFVAVYRPVVYRLARKRGLQDVDAEDQAQRVMISVRRAIDGWKEDPAQGRFRSWLAKIARNAAINALTRRPPDIAVGGTSVLRRLEAQAEPDPHTQENLERECRRSIFRRAAERIRSEFHEATWNAFWLTAVDGMEVEEAGRVLGKNVGTIYAARSRVMRRLKEEVERNRGGWEN